MNAKYSRLPGESIGDDQDSLRFNYTSAFTYSSPSQQCEMYKSPFTYGTAQPGVHSMRGHSEPSGPSKIAQVVVIWCFILVIIVTFPISLWFVVKRLKSHQRAVISRLGTIQGTKGPGFCVVIPCIDKVMLVDTRAKAFNIPPQKIMTQDSALLEMGAVVRHQIFDPEKSLFACQNLDQSMRALAQSTTVKYLSTLKEKDMVQTVNISAFLKAELQRAFTPWGVAVSSCEISAPKLLFRLEPQDPVSAIMTPLKQWLFGNDCSTPVGHMTSALMPGFSSGFTGAKEVAPLVEQPIADNPLTVNRVLSAVKSSCCTDLVQSVDAVFQFEVMNNQQTEIFYLDLKNGTGDCGKGVPPGGEPDATVTLSMEDLQRMLQGSLGPFHAYMSGQLTVTGDISSAMRLDRLQSALDPILTSTCSSSDQELVSA